MARLGLATISGYNGDPKSLERYGKMEHVVFYFYENPNKFGNVTKGVYGLKFRRYKGKYKNHVRFLKVYMYYYYYY